MGAILADGGSAVTLVPRREVSTLIKKTRLLGRASSKATSGSWIEARPHRVCPRAPSEARRARPRAPPVRDRRGSAQRGGLRGHRGLCHAYTKAQPLRSHVRLLRTLRQPTLARTSLRCLSR